MEEVAKQGIFAGCAWAFGKLNQRFAELLQFGFVAYGGAVPG